MHGVDELLNSIRSSVAEESHGLRIQRPPFQDPNAHRQPSSIALESKDFDLPAIFKPSPHTAPSDKPNLFGRLSDVLKNPPPAAAVPDRTRTVIRFEPVAPQRLIAAPPVAAIPAAQSFSQAPPRAPEPAPNQTGPKRQMPSFFDTRLNRMGELTRQATNPVPAPPAATSARPPALTLQAAEALLPDANGAVEDAAAQLLRPILKQWLTDNMPKIVEKALRSETGFESGLVAGDKTRENGNRDS